MICKVIWSFIRSSSGRNKRFAILQLVSDQVLYSNTCGGFGSGSKEMHTLYLFN